MKNIKKAVLYSPYLDTLGGGEKHILSILKVFSEEGFIIDILWRDKKILEQIESKLNIKLSRARIAANFLTQSTFFKKILATKKYNYLFYVTDGSYFFSAAEKNYIFCMYPKKDLYSTTLSNRMKWNNFEFISNSKYTKAYVDKWTGLKSTVLYPYIDDAFLKKNDFKKKDKIILSAGRYFGHLHSKRQDLLIKAFIKLQQKHKLFKNFKLIFIGGLKSEDKPYFAELKELASSNKNILFLTNVSFAKLINYYRKALFLWHAAGLTEAGRAQLYSVEHLGLVPLEAMASGVIPLCHDSGGPKEFIEAGSNGFLYKTIDDLIKQTVKAFKDQKTRLRVAESGQDFVRENFSYEVFRKRVKDYFKI